MNQSDERQFSARLSAVLDDHTPSPLPLGAVVSQGRAVRFRRRLTAIISALVAVAALVSAPAVVTALAGPAHPVASTHYHVAVHPPGKGAKKGVIATGSVDEVRWTVSAAYDARSANLCFAGAGLGVKDCSADAPPAAPQRSGAPLQAQVTMAFHPLVAVWSVRADVVRVNVAFTNGQMVTLHPVAALGRSHPRFIALGAPGAAAVTRMSAYSVSGEIAYAIPFTRALDSKAVGGGDAEIQTSRWLKPDRPPLPRAATYTIGSGLVNGRHWAEHLYLGPWGTCVDGAGYGGVCIGKVGLRLLAGGPARQLASAYVDSSIGYRVVIASAEASYLTLRLADGRSVRVAVVHVAGISFAAFVTTPSADVVRWTAHTATGTVMSRAGSEVVRQ